MKLRLSLLLLLGTLCLAAFQFIREPLTANLKDSATYRWLNKPVLESRVLDDMETLTHWHAFTTAGGEVVDARKVIKIVDDSEAVATMALDADRKHDGKQSLRMVTPTRLQGPAPKSGRGWGRSGVRRHFADEDWSSFNRISIWIYPDLPGFYTTALDFRLYNDGVEKLPALFGQEGETSLILRNHEWNHVVWEIGNVARDKITSFEMSYGLSGNTPDEADTIQFHFDQLELERVEPDKIEGWDVWPGRISFSHTGYQTGAAKRAIASNMTAKDFRLIDQHTGETVLTKPITQMRSHIGQFQVMDFSEVRTPGDYIVAAGGVSTQPFRIEADVYERTLWKALNFFYAERCGTEIPGVHGACHRDWTCVHGDKRMNINGGWHDAGDLTQGLENTGEIAYGLFTLAEKLKTQNNNPALFERVLEEALWGLDWVTKTSFGDGYRNGGSISSRRTNNILGDFDDIAATARNSPMTNFQAAAVEAIAFRVMKDTDDRLAKYALKMAEADWTFAVQGMASIKPSTEIWRGSFDSDNVQHELASQAILASVDLWKATGNKKYADKAIELSRFIVDSQQRSRTDWDVPMTGFFYTNTTKERIMHYCHRGREQGPTLALSALCEAFPNDANWMKWYSAVTLYSEYLKNLATYTEPYGVMPASVYTDQEYINVPESRKESFRKQVLNGVPLGKGHYLRLFPVWMDYRGHFGTILPQAQALASAAHLRGDLSSAQLSTQQLEWIIGKNPFSQSTMWGEGYDFPPIYTPSSGDMVGGLPVGIQSRAEADAPYWPVQNTWTYKEIWVHPVARWVWLLKDLAGPALVQGQADGEVTFVEARSKQKTTLSPDATGHFRTTLPEGTYEVIQKGRAQKQTLLPGGSYTLDLRTVSTSFDATQTTSARGEVTIRVMAQGSGVHKFSLRTDNLLLSAQEKVVTLKPGAITTLEWKAKTNSTNTPWVAVVVLDGDLLQRREVRGAAWEK
ncbi:glycoside hydrolase family 9 protein [Chryseolinea lacunae]|uniref:Glycoside hydrolase family 9 protein n=1 Tax=Chryseolinea lacunae TaxID=2801331 RepID=A0ABS1KMF0_9BACT|nr:glycoside hydrolase family 9 protein [Chryseolinea lacunae]MBL0740427.1 glycoside hydrolase family 9 protein [Chryseolinea lacunae]